MSNIRYQVCTSCNEKNDISESFCTECFSTSFTTTDESINDNCSQNVKQEDKIHDDASNKTTIEARLKQLTLGIKNMSISINHNDIVGRSGKFLEYFQNFNKVSREHAKFYFDENVWYVEDLESTNGTYINNEKILSGIKVQLHHTDILKLSTTLIATINIL
jgi:pSer/pThr/pTyr-binding forkhead associated (FHA) protein